MAISNLPLGYSPVNVEALKKLLDIFETEPNRSFLLNGFKVGFQLGCEDSAGGWAVAPRNLQSVKKHQAVAREKIREEVLAGRISGPYATPPFAELRISPIGLVAKKEPGKFRLIHHLSWPRGGGSVNDRIKQEAAEVKYTSFEAVVDQVRRFGRGALLGKTDIRGAYRLLPISRDAHKYLGFKFDDAIFIDTCLSMGLKSAPSIFEKFGKFLCKCAQAHYGRGQAVFSYLDDFFFCQAAPAADGRFEPLEIFVDLCNYLRVPLAEDKTMGPTTRIVFLGLEIDSEAMLIRVPLDKVEAASKKLRQFLGLKRICLREIQRTIGFLQFICRAVRPGRAFLQRMIALTRGLTKPHHSVRITEGARGDASMWLKFLAAYNGVTPMLEAEWEDSTVVEFFSDASSTGYGAYFGGEWFGGKWEQGVEALPIAVLELFAVALALLTWGEKLRNRKLLIWCDNQCVTNIIAKQSSRCSKLSFLLRELTLACLNFNVLVKTRYIRSAANVLADSLSRGDMARFWDAAPPGVRRTPTETPEACRLQLELRSIV